MSYTTIPIPKVVWNMSQYNDNEEKFRSTRSNTISEQLYTDMREDYGFPPAVCRSLAENFLDIMNLYYGGERNPGQVIYNAASSSVPAGRPREDVRTVPVQLTVFDPKDIQSLGIKRAGLGAEWAAIATVIAYLVGLIYIRVTSWKISSIRKNKCIFLHGLAAFFSGLVVYYLSCVVVIDRWYALIFIALFGFLLYFAILFVLREFKKQDFYLFVDTLNIKKMFGYIVEEIRHKKY